MKISEDAPPRQSSELFPIPLRRRIDQSADAQPPLCEIDSRSAAGIENRPLFGSRLPRRNTHRALCIRADDDVGGQRARRGNFVSLILRPIHAEHASILAKVTRSFRGRKPALRDDRVTRTVEICHAARGTFYRAITKSSLR